MKIVVLLCFAMLGFSLHSMTMQLETSEGPIVIDRKHLPATIQNAPRFAINFIEGVCITDTMVALCFMTKEDALKFFVEKIKKEHFTNPEMLKVLKHFCFPQEFVEVFENHLKNPPARRLGIIPPSFPNRYRNREFLQVLKFLDFSMQCYLLYFHYLR